MSTRPFIGVALALLALGACSRQQGSRSPKPLNPEGGPHTSLRVGYSGGLIHRSLTAYFRTDANAFVVVGHLGGDGVIRVIYPEEPGDPGFVQAKKTYNTDMFSAQFDGIPSLFSYSIAPYRSLNSLYDSYDGRGHGYVFVVASRRPLRTGALEENGQWVEWEVGDYTRTADPRYAVRDFAAAIAGGDDYTLRFASSFSTSHYDAYASRAWDCAMLSVLGLAYSPFWNSWSMLNYQPMGFYRHGTEYGSCGYRSASRYAWVNRGNVNQSLGTPVIIPTPSTPSEPAPQLDRPGRRGLGPRAGETTRELSAAGVGLTKRTAPAEGAEIIARPTRRASGESRPSPRESRDLTTRVAQDRRAELARDPIASSPRDRGTERRSEPARAESPKSSTSEPRSSGESSRGSSSSSARDGGRAVTSPRDARKPDGQ
jgi:hypothetical protein